MYDRIQLSLWPKRNDGDQADYERLQRVFDEALAKLEKHPRSEEPLCSYWLTETACQQLAALLQEVRASGLDAGRIELMLPDETATEWFIVSPDTWQEIDGQYDQLLQIRADRVKGKETLRRYSEDILVSERFVEFVRERKFTGLEYLWVQDKGKYAAPQWYCPYATVFLGRGVDHPWFDPTQRGRFRLDGFLPVQPTSQEAIFGVSTFTAAQVRDDLKTDPPALAEVLRLLKVMETRYPVVIRTPPRLLREFLPATDFAYLRVAGQFDKRPGMTVQLCASAQVRRELIDAKLAKVEDFEAIEVLDAVPPGARVFDRKDVPLPNALSAKQLEQARKTEARLLAKHQAKPKPPAPVVAPEIKKLIPKLKRVLKSQDAIAAKGATADAIGAAEKKLGMKIPARWVEILMAVNGFVVDESSALDGTAELRVAAAEAIPEEHQSDQEMMTCGDPDFPKTHLGVASTDIGDGIFLDTAKLTVEGDCPVVHVDHETLATVMVWPAIGLFLDDAVRVSAE